MRSGVAAGAANEYRDKPFATSPCPLRTTGAVAASKALLFHLARPIDAAVIEMAAKALADQWEIEEAAQVVAAFFDRRPTPWTNG